MATYFQCPHCGADVPVGALACPQCGSDEETGWSDQADYAHLLGYDDESESGPSSATPWGQYLGVGITALILSSFLAASFNWGIYLAPVIFLTMGLVYYVTQIRPKQGDSREKQLYQRLLRKANGDKAVVERLVAYERQHYPNADRVALLREAIDRWERDIR